MLLNKLNVMSLKSLLALQKKCFFVSVLMMFKVFFVFFSKEMLMHGTNREARSLSFVEKINSIHAERTLNSLKFGKQKIFFKHIHSINLKSLAI